MLLTRQDVQAGDRGRDTIPTLSALSGVAWIAVLLRLYTRVWVVKKVQVEDWLMAAAVVRHVYMEKLKKLIFTLDSVHRILWHCRRHLSPGVYWQRREHQCTNSTVHNRGMLAQCTLTTSALTRIQVGHCI